jgi:adenosine deaminase
LSEAKFCSALKNHLIYEIESIPKSDLHSHAGRGGKISYIEQWANVKITPPTQPFNSLDEMNQWLNDHVKSHCPPGLSGYLKRVEAAFAQAKTDNIAVLALSYAVDEVEAFGTINNFINVMNEMHKTFAPDTLFLPDLALGYNLDEQDKIDEIFSANWFKGIDICNYSGMYSINELKSICQKGKNSKLILKAHVGEFGGADDVMRYAEELELSQVQHGIATADSPQIMKWLSDHKIQLNVCPTSNVMLKNTENYQSHQIRKLFDYSVPVTINSDDLIIFNATVSQEYLNLYHSGLMTAEELDFIRQTGLASCKSN